MMSRLLFQWHFAATGVRGTFATRRATLPVNSAHRHTTVSARIAIAVLRRRPLTAPGGCRPLFYVMFLTLKCLKSRTVARQTCPLWSDCRTLSNLDLPRASPWLRGPQNWILEAVPNYYNSLLARYIHFALLGSGGSRSSLGHLAGLVGGVDHCILQHLVDPSALDHCILQHLVDPSALDHCILQHLVDPSALDHCILQHLVDPSLRASHLLLRLSLSVGDPLRWFVGVDVRFTSCSGGRGVSTVELSSCGFCSVQPSW